MSGNTPNHCNLLKYASLVCLTALLPVRGSAGQSRPVFVQEVRHARLYMTHYALFEEPDPGILPGIYLDADTGLLTDEMGLTAPLESFGFGYSPSNPGSFAMSASAPVKRLPYGVSPPGFPPFSAPNSVITAVSGVLGGSVPYEVIESNTSLFLAAIGHFEPTGGVMNAQFDGANFSVTRDTEFQVQVRIGFLFQPPAGYQVPTVGVVNWLTRGMVDLLIGAAPDPNTASDLVVYDWRATMALSTGNSYIREIAKEPRTVADGWPAGLDAIQFIGAPVDSTGHYTIVGHAEHVTFTAPPELVQFLFGTSVLTDVEFAVEESGVLTPVPADAVCTNTAAAGCADPSRPIRPAGRQLMVPRDYE